MQLMRRSLPLVLLATAACGESAPCAPTQDCPVTGVDLAIVDAQITQQNRIGMDDVTGLPIHAAAPVTVDFTIVNRGNAASQTQLISTGELLPPLAPGQSVTVSVTHNFTGDVQVQPPGSAADARNADRRVVGLELVPSSRHAVLDADPSNDSRVSPPFHVAMPVLTGTMEPLDELRANHATSVAFRLDNISVHGGDAPPVDVALCLMESGAGCTGDWTFFGRHDIAGLTAGSSLQDAYVTMIDMPAMIDPDAAHDADVALCIVPDDLEGAYLDRTDSCLASSGTATIRPDYLACSPPLVQPHVFMSLPTPNCGEAVADPDRLFHVVAFDADASQMYHVQGAPFFVYDVNGDPAPMRPGGFSFTNSGRYYLVAEGPDPIFVFVRIL